MKKYQFFYKYFFIAFFLLFANSCKHESDVTNLRKVCYENEIKPIFTSNCIMCHDSTKKSAGVDLTNYQGILQTLTKGNPERSELYTAISNPYGEFMPPAPANALTKDQRTLIYVWISQNADTTACQ